jgi:hypothetical protein
MKDIIQKIVRERNHYRENLYEALDLLSEMNKRYDVSKTDEEYINEMIERDLENKIEIEMDIDNDMLNKINEISSFIDIKKEEAIEKILEIELEN